MLALRDQFTELLQFEVVLETFAGVRLVLVLGVGALFFGLGFPELRAATVQVWHCVGAAEYLRCALLGEARTLSAASCEVF